MREIIFDTETTGFEPGEHRILEIGAIEMINRLPTGRTFHKYINPQREIDWTAARVHGITEEKVKDAPLFADIANDMLDFFADAVLVAHNASFDKSFINMELGRIGLPEYPDDRFLDTLELAKKKLPGQRHNLDALCRHFNIDLSARTFHGALLDAQLLADVYVELTGGLQGALVLESESKVDISATKMRHKNGNTNTQIITPEAEETTFHRQFLASSIPNHRWPTE